MKKVLSILAVSFSLIGMVACDKIEEGDYIKDNTNVQSGSVVKNVLLEDYTGVRCVNCPAAGEGALELQHQYGHKVIVLGVHAGSLSSVPPNGLFPNFTTEEGTEWYNTFGLVGNPIGTINRKLNGATFGFDSSKWTEAVIATLQEEAVVEMNSIVNFDEASRNLEVSIFSKFLEEKIDTTFNLTVCIMEDSITGMQVTPQGNNPNYVHRHVFRETMNGTWGESLNGTTENPTVIAPKEMFIKTYTTTLDEAYNADQCYIIAYVANSETKEILQVIEKKIK
jgi:hypothetical protein